MFLCVLYVFEIHGLGVKDLLVSYVRADAARHASTARGEAVDPSGPGAACDGLPAVRSKLEIVSTSNRRRFLLVLREWRAPATK